VGQFAKTIQKRLKLASDKPISIFVNDVLAPTASLLTAVYKEHKCVSSAAVGCPLRDLIYYISRRDQDDFLYLTYSSDSTSGGC
jgi:GABA(A) receptor-associated protein